jgi:hypothetical protein
MGTERVCEATNVVCALSFRCFCFLGRAIAARLHAVRIDNNKNNLIERRYWMVRLLREWGVSGPCRVTVGRRRGVDGCCG